MENNPFPDSLLWRRIKKLAALANILAVVVAGAWFAYTVWHDYRRQPQPVTGDSVESPIMSLWTPTYVIGAALLLTATLHLIAAVAAGRRERKRKTEIEIISPFDDEKVNLYETVWGRVFPSNTAIQVLVFAGDKKWYPQGPVSVKGLFWSVKCQFGNQDGPGGGAYKIVAVLGAELEQGMWYGSLPDRVKSNIVQVQRQESTVEQRLSTALNDLKNAKLAANQERGTKDEIYKLYRDTERKLAELTWLASLAAEQAKNIADYVVATIATYPSAGELVLEGNELCIILGLNIRNESVFDISILPKGVSGSMAVNGKFLKEPASILVSDIRTPIENLQPRKTQMLVLEQPLRQSEAERITKSLNEAGAKIWIGGLTILISSSNSSMKVEPKQARLSDRDGYIPLTDFKCNTKIPDGND